MEFSVTKSALLNELNTTQGAVERNTTIPANKHVRWRLKPRGRRESGKGAHDESLGLPRLTMR
jgi:hypothetical protein